MCFVQFGWILVSQELRRTYAGTASLQNVVPLLLMISFQSPFWVTDDEINELGIFGLWDLWCAKWRWDRFVSKNISYPLSLSSPQCSMLMFHSSAIDATWSCNLSSWRGCCFKDIFLSVFSCCCVALYSKQICLHVVYYWKTANFYVRFGVVMAVEM